MSTVKLKRSSVSSKVPVVGDLDWGELAVNTYDGKLYMKVGDGVDRIVLLADAFANTDMSGTEILNQLITVDGASSGLDADLLDGQHGSYYYSPANAPDPTLTLAGDASGSATFTNLGDATLTVTIADDSHTHDGRYYTETESDSRFVNVDGDTMTSTLTIDKTANTSGSAINLIMTTGSHALQMTRDDQDSYFSINGNAGHSNISMSSYSGTYHGFTAKGFDLYYGVGSDSFNPGFDNNLMKFNATGFFPSSNANNALDLGSPTRVWENIYASNFHGDGSNVSNVDAATAVSLATARTITLGGDVSGSASFDGSSDITITTTIDGSNHSHEISDVNGLQTALDSKLNLSGGALTGDLTFSDNVKAIFGAGSDLQIYHDGSNSYIQDSGTGLLQLRTNGTEISLTGQSGTEFMGRFQQDGAVTLYYDNAQKFATTATGIDVTGTVEADGLTVSGDSDMTGALTIDVDNVQDGALRIEANQTNPNNDFYFAQMIVSTLSGTTATTADREQGGIYMDINSTATGGDTSNEHRAYGMYIDLDSTGDSDLVYGVYADATATPAEGTTSTITGLFGRAEDNGGAGFTTSVYGVRGVAASDNSQSDVGGLFGGHFTATATDDSGPVTNAYGVFAEIDIASGGSDVLGDSYVVRATLDNNSGVAQTNSTYLFYGDYTGTLPTNAYGVYINSDVPSYFKGNVGIRTTSPSEALDVRSGSFNSSVAQFTGASNGRGLLISTFQRASNDDSVDYDAQFGGHHTFSSSGSEKVRIDNTGNVGIGTTNPGSKLDVNGSITTDGLTSSDLITLDTSNPTPLVLKRNGGSDSNVNIKFDQASYNTWAGAGSTGDFVIGRNADLAVQRGFAVANNGDVSFYEDTGTTAEMVWDASAEALTFSDNVKATFGAGSDLQIYHDGSNSYITDAGTGDLKIRGAAVSIETVGGNLYFKGDANIATLYHTNAAKLSTTSTGIDVTGNATFGDSGKAIFGAGSDLQIYHNGTNSVIADTGSGNLSLQTNGIEVALWDTANGQYLSQFVVGGEVGLYHNGSKKFTTTSTGIDVTGTVTADEFSGGVVASETDSVIGSMLTLDSQSSSYRWNNTTAGRPASSQTNEYGTLLHLNYNGSLASQFAWDIDQDNLYLRTLNTSTNTGTDWKRVLTTDDGVSITEGVIEDSTATTTATTQVAIDSWSATTYGGGKLLIEAKDGSDRHIVELLVTHDGTTAIATEYGAIYTSNELATYDVDISAGNVRILATPDSTNSTTFKVIRTTMYS